MCRLNKRLGNTLFVTPLIRSLAGAFPGARIDVLVRDPAHRGLLEGLPGVHRIIHVPEKPAALAAFMLRFRRRRYDLAIDPSINAVSNRLAISLCRARHKLGFAGPEQWVRLTHAAEIPAAEPHQARQAVHLLREGIPGVEAPLVDNLEVRPDGAARAGAWRALVDALGGPKRAEVIGFFIGATGGKRLPEEWWKQWARAIQSGSDAPRLLQVLPPGAGGGLSSGMPTVSFEKLDRLAALMGHLDLFVAADCGPMHLAAAARVPTIGLFRATAPGEYAPLGRDCMILGPDALDPGIAAERALAHLHGIQGQLRVERP